jgi:hypothetical protein
MTLPLMVGVQVKLVQKKGFDPILKREIANWCPAQENNLMGCVLMEEKFKR